VAGLLVEDTLRNHLVSHVFAGHTDKVEVVESLMRQGGAHNHDMTL